MSKPTIAVDLDDVLGNENHAMMHFINTRYDRTDTPEDYDITAEYWGYWHTVWGVDPVQGEAMYEEFIRAHAEGAVEQELVSGALAGINHLKKDYELVIITSRRAEIVESTGKWLQSHFPNTFRDVQFTALRGDRRKISKAQICNEIHARYLIDDNAEHCSVAQEAGVQALLFGDYGWNRAAAVPEAVVKVKDWRAVREYFDGVRG